MKWNELKKLLEPTKLSVVPPEDRGLKGRKDITLSTGVVLPDYPVGKFDIVYLDPPWAYSDKLHQGERGVAHKYNTMTMEELSEMPLLDLLHKDSMVAMWITPPQMQDAMLLANLWGLEMITRGFLWVKLNKNNNLPFRGLGHWTRGNPEDCYFFRPKGSKFKPQFIPDELVRDRRREHSRKPDMVRNRLNQICGAHHVHKVELFSRESADGWVSFGDGAGLAL